ncbi:MAG: hypothetical protein P8M70_08750 [Verrucomicrobiota bacterium]|nr:hypothetical protein [Verrucomicrobiota bacterium]
MNVEVETIGDDEFLVEVSAATSTEHHVTLTDAYWEQIWNSRLTKKEIVSRSFAFLLEREPNSSIMRTFDLPVIQRYFSEYEGIAATW